MTGPDETQSESAGNPREGRPPGSGRGDLKAASAARRFPWGVPNPFYLLSATAFIHATTWPGGAAGDSSFGTGTQLLLAAVYTVLCAGTAVWLVRSLGRWDDARSLVVIVTGMFAVASYELDAWLPTVGRPLRLGATLTLWGVTVATLEAVRRGCRVPIAGRFLTAVYAQWALLLTAPAMMSADVATARLQIVAFAVLSAGAWLLYLPSAGRMRPTHRESLGWAYPYCPWTLAVLTGGATLARLAFLSVSFDAVPDVRYAGSWNWSTILGGDLLVPYLLTAGLVLATAGVRTGSGTLQSWGVKTAVGSLLLLMLPLGPVATAFRESVRASVFLVTPVLLTIATLAWMLRADVRTAAGGLLTTLLLGGWLLRVGEQTGVADGLGMVCWGVAAGWGYVIGWRDRQAGAWLAATVTTYAAMRFDLPIALRDGMLPTAEPLTMLVAGVGAIRVRGDGGHLLAAAAGALWGYSFVYVAPVWGVAGASLTVWTVLPAVTLLLLGGPFAWRFRDNPLVALVYSLGLLAGVSYGGALLIRRALQLRYFARLLTLTAAAALYAGGVWLSRAKTRAEQSDDALGTASPSPTPAAGQS